MSADAIETDGRTPSTRRRRRALVLAFVALAVLPQCCCCVVPIGYGPRLVPGLHKVLPAASRTPLAEVALPSKD